VLLQTRVGDRVLEIGSGTGKISLQIALAGRAVTCVDSSAASLTLVRRCAASLSASISAVQSDATLPLPFANAAFDCVWSSGLLEHFTAAERRSMLCEWARVCKRQMIHLVPNAASLAYRFGKAEQERSGQWPYGLEMPLVSLRDDFAAAGIRVTAEFTVAPHHGLNFIHDPQIRLNAARLIAGRSPSELRDWQQGYLLITIGVVS
jgi:SAM-dependent methyltransferase